MLTEDQIVQIKQQIIEQIKSTFPEDKKQSSIERVNSMNPGELEKFLKQNQILQEKGQASQTECIFCLIVNKQTPCYLIDENKDSLAVLEINPISKAHCLVIPKKHVSSNKDIPKAAFSLAKKIAKKLKAKFKPKDVKIYFQNLFGHEIINILPIYGKENLNSERTKENPKQLEKLQEKLKKKEQVKKPKIMKKSIKPKKTKEKLWLPKRIP